MYLKRLELQGFKSFSEKTKLEFREGVTAVVGSNGSGKSNISDAVRWVLGEANAKALRGDKMEDVIFAGTKKKKPVGMAEVSLILDNSDKKLKVEYDEVKVTRCIFRSGESKYYINGAECRLKDIHELFMDTGIGRDGYSIISQGKIDDILSTKSEDRRAVFEEAAGIIKLKKSKAETEKKLEDATDNLRLAQVAVDELESRLEPSRKQAERTKKYLGISERLKNIRTELFIYNYDMTLEQIKKYKDDIEMIDNSIQTERISKKECENEKKRLAEKSAENETKFEEITKLSGLSIEKKQEIQTEIKLISKNMEFADSEKQRLSKELEKGHKRIAADKNEIAIREGRLSAKKITLEAKTNELNLLKEKNEGINDAFKDIEQKEKDFNEELSEKNNSLFDMRSNQSTLAQRLDDTVQAIRTLSENKEISKSRLDEMNVHLKALELSKNDISLKQKEALKQAEENRLKITENKEQTDSLRKKKNDTMMVLTSINSKHSTLSELENSYGGYNNAVRAVLMNKAKLGGIYGSVAELISTREQYETAIEVAVGSAMQNIITDNENSAKKAIEYLERERRGRATFLPLSSIKGRTFFKTEALNEKNVIGTADSLVTADKKYASIVSHILGNILVVKTIDDAIHIGKKYGYAFRIVCLDGKVLNQGGSMTGGSLSGSSVQIFSRNREIRQLELEREKKKLELKEIFEKLKELALQRESLDEQEKICGVSLDNIENKISEISLDYERTTENISRISETSENEIKELERLQAEQKNIRNDIDKTAESIKSLKSDIDEISGRFAQYRDEIRTSRSKKEKQLSEMNILMIDINNVKNEMNNINTEIEGFNKSIANILDNEKSINKAIEGKISENSRNEQKTNDLHKKTEEIETELIELEEKKAEIRKEKESIKNRTEELSVKLINYTSNEGRLESEKQRIIARKESLEEKNKILVDDMWNRYEISYAQALSLPKSGKERLALEKDKTELENEVSSLGSINPNAVEEYEEIRKKYDFNISQRNDIIKAMEDLRNIIDELVEDMKKRFSEQFEQINKSFAEVFNKMFGGDSFASIRLTDEDDVLSSGIEIIAEPDGKTTKKLSLLSGGERALTAIALLFGIINLKPSPFCILDEIEAALDDTNVLRFANYLSGISENNQFIIITHKVGTMEVADVLYGVTMEEQGVSKIISVDFEK